MSLRATGAWELPALHEVWRQGRTSEEGLTLVRAELARVPEQAAEQPSHRRVLTHSSGFQLSPYADVKPAGDDTRDVARKLWHRSPGSPG